MRALKEVDPRFVEFFIETAIAEREMRHKVAKDGIELLHKNNEQEYRIKMWGMLYALISLVLFIGLAVVALFFDKPWIASIFGVLSIGTVVTAFISGSKTNREEV